RRTVNNFRGMLIAKYENRLLNYVQEHNDIYSLTNAHVLSTNPEARAYIFTEMGRQNPKMMIKRLSEYAKEPFADDIISRAAQSMPMDIYNYATSTNYTLSNAIRRSKDPLVQAIVRITQESKSPLKAM